MSAIKELLDLSRKQLIEECLKYNKTLEEVPDIAPLECPVHIWVVEHKQKCSRDTVPNTMLCPVCNNPCCPDCMNHKVEQISRVTGYLSNVEGWNAAKKQEFADRQHHNIG
jgi:hypothetical protein